MLGLVLRTPACDEPANRTETTALRSKARFAFLIAIVVTAVRRGLKSRP